ncbi:hypothetical protein Tco_0520418 [Tanacetum coccineum]
MEDGIFFNQSKYIKEMLKKFGLEDSKPTKTPMSTEIKLTKDDEADYVDSSKYQVVWDLFTTQLSWNELRRSVQMDQQVVSGLLGPIPPKTAEQKLARKNELKAKSTLMLVIPDEYLLKFYDCKDAKSLWEAIKIEGLDKTYDRFQKLISQLEIHGEVISQENANLKLLRSLPSTWNNIALIMRNKYDLDTLSMDDLYNNLKVYESEIKGKLSSSSNSQNVAFVSFDNSSSTNETVNTAHSVSAASSKD